MDRRDVLEWLAAAPVAGTAGCVGSLADRPGGAPGTGGTPGDGRPCDESVYDADGADADGALPWDLHVRNVALDTYPVAISIADVSGDTPEVVVSCTATAASHAELVFDLSPGTSYRITATLHRPGDPETATTTVAGWNRVSGPNEALEVAMDDGEFAVRRVHYDVATTPTGTDG